MNPEYLKFTNELGNEIEIDITGSNYELISKGKDPIEYKTVIISIIGPTSTSDNEITLNEAKNLYLLLGNHLKNQNALLL